MVNMHPGRSCRYIDRSHTSTGNDDCWVKTSLFIGIGEPPVSDRDKQLTFFGAGYRRHCHINRILGASTEVPTAPDGGNDQDDDGDGAIDEDDEDDTLAAPGDEQDDDGDGAVDEDNEGDTDPIAGDEQNDNNDGSVDEDDETDLNPPKPA